MNGRVSTRQQRISRNLLTQLDLYLKDKTCEPFAAPFDVRLPEKEEQGEQTMTVVQPDLVVICDPEKIDEKGCLGAPDLVVEILSPATAYKDETDKLKLYETHGVKEYWIINPEVPSLQQFLLKENSYMKPEYLKPDEVLTSPVLGGFKLKLSEIFG